ncbi:MAG: hypothetical protein F6J93_21500 [Oscillatoria sp. SIO1A7]|nr:hypothetical protein [Oscillatoria sp. SIO1A7]
MLSPDDENSLIEVGKNCKASDFSVDRVTDCLVNNTVQFASLTYFIITDNNGRMDTNEAKLLRWARRFVLRIKKDEGDIERAVTLIKKGFDST